MTFFEDLKGKTLTSVERAIILITIVFMSMVFVSLSRPISYCVDNRMAWCQEYKSVFSYTCTSYYFNKYAFDEFDEEFTECINVEE
jgi:hypothetical protein